jgi:hypothetical protein
VGVWSTETRSVRARLPGTMPGWLPDGRLHASEVAEAEPGQAPNLLSVLVSVFSPDLSTRTSFRLPAPPDPQRRLSFFGFNRPVWWGDRLVGLQPETGWSVGDVQLTSVLGTMGHAAVGLAIQEPNGGPRKVLLAADEMVVGRGIPVLLGVPTSAVLFWTRRCLGLFETVCSYRLHRFSLPDGADEVIAVSDDFPMMAVSPDGRRAAIGTRRGIFVKELP